MPVTSAVFFAMLVLGIRSRRGGRAASGPRAVAAREVWAARVRGSRGRACRAGKGISRRETRSQGTLSVRQFDYVIEKAQACLTSEERRRRRGGKAEGGGGQGETDACKLRWGR